MEEKTFLNRDLAEGIRSGDRRVFEHLFRLYYSSLKSYARLILKNPTVAEEMVQEVFVKLWETHSLILIESSVKAYLFRCVHNQCVNYIKNSRVNSRLTTEALNEMAYHAELVLQNFSEELLEKLITAEQEEHLNNVIEGLPAQCREIYLLSRQENLTYIQIGNKLGLSVNTVKTQISRALTRLKEMHKEFLKK